MNISDVMARSPVASRLGAEVHVCTARNRLGYTGKEQGLAGPEGMVPGQPK
jgi:hypothetical protein